MVRLVDAGPPPGLVRLGALAGLDAGDVACLAERLAPTGRAHPARRDLYVEGSRLTRALLVAEGWAYRFRLLGNGRRQIVGFCLPGDLIGAPLQPLTASLGSVTRLSLVELPTATKVIARALARIAALDEAYLLNQIVRLGRQTAYERTAHLMLELRDRLDQAGLVDEGRFPMPLTQELLADALGLSSVHVNRTLQVLRREQMLALDGGMARILMPDMLALRVDYAPARR